MKMSYLVGGFVDESHQVVSTIVYFQFRFSLHQLVVAKQLHEPIHTDQSFLLVVVTIDSLLIPPYHQWKVLN
jgi:hypothetical protein